MNEEMFLAELEKALEVEAGSLSMTVDLNTIPAWDSLAVLSLISLVDQYFEGAPEPSDLINCKTPAEIYQCITQHSVA